MLPQLSSTLRRCLAFLFVSVTLCLPAGATWSIVAVNAKTGEVAVAVATCLLNFNLREGVPVIVVGQGAAAAQSLIDLSAINRTIMYGALQAGATPAQVLASVAGSSSHQQRQYGIVSMSGPPVTFTGRRAGAAASGVTGMAGDYYYAIQGNVLTDDAVVLAAEAAFVATNGDMGQRLMAGMQAAKALGGDGRCSCSQNMPTSCGAPPPNFTKSAHIGTVIIARVGDEDKPCSAAKGCARGSYYLTLNVANATASAPDPVDQLQTKYDNWRAAKLARPDGILSTVESVESLPADGVTQRTVTVRLANIDGVFFNTGGATVQVAPLGGQPSLTSVGPVTDRGDGVYSFVVTAGNQPGTDTFVITADNGGQKVTTLYPYLSLRSDPVTELHAGRDQLTVGARARVPMVMNVPGAAGANYFLVGSLNGTQPGTSLPEVFLPLNAPLISPLLTDGGGAGGGLLGALGRLDANGRAEMAFVGGSTRLLSLVGRRLDFSALYAGPGGVAATNAVGFDIVP